MVYKQYQITLYKTFVKSHNMPNQAKKQGG